MRLVPSDRRTVSNVNNFPAFSSIPSGVKRIIPSPCVCSMFMRKESRSMIRKSKVPGVSKNSYFYIYICHFPAIGYGTVMLLLLVMFMLGYRNGRTYNTCCISAA